MRRWVWRGLWHVFVFCFGFFSLVGFPLPKAWNPVADWMVSLDVWVINHVAYPGLFAIFAGLLIGTIIIPDFWALARPRLLGPAHSRPDLTLREVVRLILGVAIGTEAEQNVQRGEIGDLLDQLREAASRSHLTVWGSKTAPGKPGANPAPPAPLEPIPGGFWESHKIDLARFFTERRGASADWLGDSDVSYEDLHFDRDGVKAFHRTWRRHHRRTKREPHMAKMVG